MNFSQLVTRLCKSEDRTLAIARLVREKAKKTRLILTSRREHGAKLHELLPGSKLCMGGCKDISVEKHGVLISTFSFASEGLDISHLDCVVLASPISSPSLLEQCIGRVLRGSASTPLIIDFKDSHPMFLAMFRKRRAFYRKNYKIR